jgi:hypothetical protein
LHFLELLQQKLLLSGQDSIPCSFGFSPSFFLRCFSQSFFGLFLHQLMDRLGCSGDHVVCCSMQLVQLLYQFLFLDCQTLYRSSIFVCTRFLLFPTLLECMSSFLKPLMDSVCCGCHISRSVLQFVDLVLQILLFSHDGLSVLALFVSASLLFLPFDFKLPVPHAQLVQFALVLFL